VTGAAQVFGLPQRRYRPGGDHWPPDEGGRRCHEPSWATAGARRRRSTCWQCGPRS